MKIARRTGGGRGVYELAAVQEAGLSPAQLVGKRLVIGLPGGLRVPTGIEYTNQGGKPRLRIADATSTDNGEAIHVHRQIAALLLLPKPTRSSDSVGSGEPVLVKDAYFLEEATVTALSIDGDDLLIELGHVDVANSDCAERVVFTQRLAAVTRAWADAETYPEATRELLLEHRSHVMSGAPLGHDTECLVESITAAIDTQLTEAIVSVSDWDPTTALDLAAEHPPFSRDEALLLMDAYVRSGVPSNPESAGVSGLAELLNRLNRMNGLRARRTNADVIRGLEAVRVATSGSSGDEVIDAAWREYGTQRATLAAIAREIRLEVMLQDAPPAVPEDEELTFPEGRQMYRRHRQRERSSKLTRQKKANVLHATGALACEVCGFDFAATYHELGDGYIECHHNVAISSYATESRTRLEDLSVVCANCHRILHRRRPWLTADELKEFMGHS
ncbi:MAG: HNH endonuclease [Actinomycetota bacterium]|nr:HNH endonuclease [Actinomycetota bacterium]